MRMTIPRVAACIPSLAIFVASGSPLAGTPPETGPASGNVGPEAQENAGESAEGQELVAEGLGLRFTLPGAAFVRTDSSDGVLRYELIDGRPDPRWRMRVQGLVASDPAATVETQLADYLASLRSSGTEFAVRIDEPIEPTEGAKGRLAILESDLGDGASATSGWALFPRGEGVFLVMSLLVSAGELEGLLPDLRRSLASVRLLGADAVERERGRRIDRGAEIVRAIGEDRLRSAIAAEPRWFRTYRPAADGEPEVELGFVRLETRDGRRGEVDPTRTEASYRGPDLEEGLLVRLDARSLVPGEPTRFTVTQGRFWVSWDRLQETWSVRSAVHDGRNRRNVAETGVRTPTRPGSPRPKLTVITASAEKLSRDPEEWAVPPNYVSQAELQVLGRLLPPPPEDADGERFILYAYEPKTGSLPQRTETWRRGADGGGTLETRLAGGPVSIRRSFDAAGEPRRREDRDVLGPVVTEPIGRPELEALYRAKGIPLE